MGGRDRIDEKRTPPAAGKTAVVIPYYQEKPGILRGAVV